MAIYVDNVCYFPTAPFEVACLNSGYSGSTAIYTISSEQKPIANFTL